MRTFTHYSYGWSSGRDATFDEIEWFMPKAQLVDTDGTYHCYGASKSWEAAVNEKGYVCVWIHRLIPTKGEKHAEVEVMVLLKPEVSAKTVQFELAVVWDQSLSWWIKEKDASHFGLVGVHRDGICVPFEGPIKHEKVEYADWETEPLLQEWVRNLEGAKRT